MNPLLKVENLKVQIEGKEILKGIDLQVAAGELHVIMGPNGSGKSTLAYSLMGHPSYQITRGEIVFDGKKINQIAPDVRARAGMFLGFQQPVAIPGLALHNFLTSAVRSTSQIKETPSEYGMLADKMAKQKALDDRQFKEEISGILEDLKMKEELVYRDLNEGFSGGEKKKVEIMQMALLKPRLAILDEPDSGLDIDALKLIAKKIDKMHKEGLAVILVTHYQRILQFLKPDRVHILRDGLLIKSGGPDLAKQIEEHGYQKI
jgi:Fe-S cluster assembly ATP-binding protein